MPKTREDFQPDVGGFLDDVEGDIVDAEFAIATGDYADKVMMGRAGAKPPVVVKLYIKSLELERPATQSYSVGSPELWEILDNGKSVKNVKNPDKHTFRKGSRAWALIEAMMTSVGDGDLEKGQDFFIKRDTYMTEAKFYTGLSFHWAVQSLGTVGGGTTNTPLPEKFLGESKSKVAPKVAPRKEDSALDAIIIVSATDKTERELKSFAVRNPDIKKNDAYMKAVVSGKKLRQLEEEGKLLKDPETEKYI